MRTVFFGLLSGLFCALAAPVIAAEPEHGALAARAQDILKANCYRCHGREGTNEGGFNYVLDFPKLLARKKIVAGNPGRSRLYQRLGSNDDPMPPAEEKVRPGKDDIALLRRWIEAGAPPPPGPQGGPGQVVERRFISPKAMVRSIRADLERVHERDRRFTRYFTLTHLHNAGLSADELQSYRHGLSKLVNSLSWGSRVVVPRPVDTEKTIFRIDLRDYQWNEKVWEAILAANPYGVAAGTEAARFCSDATHCPLPFVRGDWFVAAAARPPLYHEILQLPGTDAELEKVLRVDVAEDVRQERVARAGFNGSGVSRNTRLIERHESGAVVYWKSYDFTSNTGRRNLFAHPLGPSSANPSHSPLGRGQGEGFTHDGGEIIFNLPNGLQGYLLVDAGGQRLDKGPTAVVSDPKRPDRAVENGISCMSCHARGMIEKADQVRAHVLKNRKAFAESDVATVLALYPPTDEFTALLRRDARRFQEAVAQTGAPLSVTEPIAALALRFEAELDLPLAAAEAGVPPEKLLAALDRSPPLAQQLGSLKVEGGTIQRQVFVDAFADLVRELKLGDYLPPERTAYNRLVRQGDALLQKGDPDGALKVFSDAVALDPERADAYTGRGDAHRDRGALDRATAEYDRALRADPKSALAFNNRGLLYKRKGDLDRALADFTEAIRLDPRFAVAYHNRGGVRHGKGEYDDAIADYDEALRLDPGWAVAFNNRGLAHFEKGDDVPALADFKEALRLDPKLAVAYNNRGLARTRKAVYDQAIADFTEAVRLDPKFARAYYNRGIAHEKKGDIARADADRARALQLDPKVEEEP